MLENVKNLNTKSEENEYSDAGWMVARLRKKRFVAWFAELDALETNSPVPRIRLYWCGLHKSELMNGVNVDQVTHLFLKIYKSLKNGPKPDLTEYITLDDELRQMESDRCGLPSVKGTGLRPALEDKAQPDWKLYHKELFSAQGMEWPFDIAMADPCQLAISGLLRREAEASWYLHKVFPVSMQGPDRTMPILEFIDINPTIVRVIASCFDENRTVKKSPWKLGAPPTLVGSSKIIVRATVSSSKTLPIRVLDGIEYFRLIGWDDGDWRKFDWSSSWENEWLCTEGLANLAGNAFSAYQFGPWQMAMMATYGKFGRHCAAVGDRDGNPGTGDAALVVSSSDSSESYSSDSD